MSCRKLLRCCGRIVILRLQIFELQQQFPLTRNKITSFKYQQILITVLFWDVYRRWIDFPLVVDFIVQTWSGVLVRPSPLHSAPNFNLNLLFKDFSPAASPTVCLCSAEAEGWRKNTFVCDCRRRRRACSSLDSVSGCRLTFSEVLNESSFDGCLQTVTAKPCESIWPTTTPHFCFVDTDFY